MSLGPEEHLYQGSEDKNHKILTLGRNLEAVVSNTPLKDSMQDSDVVCQHYGEELKEC